MINLLKSDKLHLAAVIIIAIIAGAIFVQLFAQVSFEYNSFSFNLRTEFKPAGGTVINVPPVGQLYLKSHHVPWQLIITLNEIDFQKLEKQLDLLTVKEAWLEVFQKEVTRAVLTLFGLVLTFSLLGSTLVLLAIRIKVFSRPFWLGLASSFLLTLVLIIGVAATYDQSAIERPQYQGVLASAPWAMNLVTMSLDNIEVIGENLKLVSKELPKLYEQAGQIKSMSQLQHDLAVLHVSDIHNNPAALEFISQLVTNFKIGLIIDTGDLTDYGTALEAEIINKIAQFKVPYVFIPGNHDTPLIVDRLKKLPQVKLLTEGKITIKGLTIAGLADPSTGNYSSDMATKEQLLAFQEKFTQYVSGITKPPEIIAVHNRILAEKLIGKIPLIIHGHDHKYALAVTEDTVINDTGTTGAAGIRGLTKDGVPYSATILYWRKGQSGELKLEALDSIKINGTAGRLTIERHTFSDGETEEIE